MSVVPKDIAESGSCHVVVALMQKTLDNKPKFGISFSLYKVNKALYANREGFDTVKVSAVSYWLTEATLV